MKETTVGIDQLHIPRPRDDLYPSVIQDFDYAFAENGLTAYKLGVKLPSQSFINYLGEERYKPLVNFILHYIADLDIPLKRFAIFYYQSIIILTFICNRGTFVEYRNGMINVSPLGRNAR